MKNATIISMACMLVLTVAGCGGDGGPSKRDIENLLLEEGWSNQFRPITFSVQEGRQNLKHIGQNMMKGYRLLEEAGFLTIEEMEADECILTVTEAGLEHCHKEDYETSQNFVLRTVYVKSVDSITMEEDGVNGMAIYTLGHKNATKYTEELEELIGRKFRTDNVFQYEAKIGLHGPDQVWHIFWSESYYPSSQ